MTSIARLQSMSVEQLVLRISSLEIIELKDKKRREQRVKANKKYSEKNKDTIKEKKAQYYQKNKGRYAENLRNWRARKAKENVSA
jgi:hypothetical protein